MESPPPPPGATGSAPLLAMDAPPLDPPPSPFSWDWSDLLDFNIDDQLNTSLEFDQSPVDREPDPSPPASPNQGTPDRVRKRDPRLICSNFLAGLVPCACPELDAKLEEEQQGLPEKKKTRRASSSAGKSRCQVIGCEADISHLKGYHRRHRVCLQCANASAVVIDGERKRYCQQCGKFHLLSDFDEGKRSCRRKLARHNNRRRRKPSESVVNREGESQGLGSSDDVACDDDNSKGGTNSIPEEEPLLESDEQNHIICSNPVADNIPNESVISFVESGGIQIIGGEEDSKFDRPLSSNDNKSAYSSACPTGRISFKLYDWNPAEFPRRLRHQIFQWLASMPVELEGYIRPGCTIFTVFVSMPDSMWLKLLEKPVMHIRDFVADPGKMLSGRGPLLVYLDSVIFRAMRDGTSVKQVKVKEESPKLHYVHPTCFEAGKPIKFKVHGSYLLQPKFRFLVSFEGRYLAYNCCLPPRCGNSGRIAGHSEHHILEVYIPRTELDHFGPAFIEVENESGISNFIPILIGSKAVCSEVKILEATFENPCYSKRINFMDAGSVSDSSEVPVLRQTSFSQFILDAGWLIRKVATEDVEYKLNLAQAARFNRLLTFLIQNKSASLLDRILHHIETVVDKIKSSNLKSDVTDADMNLLLSNLDSARDFLAQRHQDKIGSLQASKSLVLRGDCLYQRSEIGNRSDSFVNRVKLQDLGTAEREIIVSVARSNSEEENRPLLSGDVVMSINGERPRNSCNRVIRNRHVTSRHLMFAVASLAVCLCVCVVLFHPQKVGRIATTVRRCMLNKSSWL